MFRVANTGETIPAKFDGALRSVYANNQDFIVSGVGDEFALTYTSGSLVLNCGTGVANISGRGISAEEINSIELPNNSTIYLCLRIDLTQIQGQEGMLYANTTSQIADDNLSNANGVHDMLLAVITTNATTITGITDKRNIRQGISPQPDNQMSSTSENPVMNRVIYATLDGKKIKALTLAQYNALSSKDSNTIYIVY